MSSSLPSLPWNTDALRLAFGFEKQKWQMPPPTEGRLLWRQKNLFLVDDFEGNLDYLRALQ